MILQSLVRFSKGVLDYHSLTLVPMAATNPITLKLSSLAEQRARPPITGSKDRFT